MADRQRIRSLPYSVQLVSQAAYDDLLATLEPTTNPLDRDTKPDPTGHDHPFLDALHAPTPGVHLDASSTHNKMLTENLGVTLSSTKSALVDLFYELEKAVKPDRLGELLDKAWEEDVDSTLKLCFQARSIPNGKGERESFYRCVGWLVQNGHWQTVLRNLEALVKPLAPKPKPKRKPEEDRSGGDGIVDEGEQAELDAHNARSTGYYKDLANLLVLSAVGQLRIDRDMTIVPGCSALENRKRGYTARRTADFNGRVDKAFDESTKDKLVPAAAADGEKEGKLDNEARNRLHSQTAKELRTSEKDDQLASVTTQFEDPKPTFHRALHLTVARLFAAQLALDASHLSQAEQLASNGDRAGSDKLMRKVSLAAKWAPTPGHFHDRHAFLSPSIAELLDAGRSLHPNQSPAERESAFHGVMASYRRGYLSPLRARLDVVERHLSASTLGEIKYGKVPSVAMNRYASTFWEKDRDRFDGYLVRVAEGKANISGAALTPAQLVHQVRNRPYGAAVSRAPSSGEVKRKVEARMADLQWKSMVESVAAGGKLENAIAVADVSGSMQMPAFSDGTVPMDSSIGLSILLAQLVQPPFRGHVITFSANPTFLKLEEGQKLSEMVKTVEEAEWGMNTDLVLAFEKILEKAVVAKVPPESMVKRVFVFSDMEWDSAVATDYTSSRHSSVRTSTWDTHYDILQRKFSDAGYDLPELVFWNLAGGRTGIASKPVEKETPGTAMVSGYSGAMVKLFLEGGDPADEEEVVEKKEGDDGEGEEWEKVDDDSGEEEEKEEGEGEPERKKARMDPVSVMKKAIAHESFVGIKVYD